MQFGDFYMIIYIYAFSKGFPRMIRYGYLGLFLVWHFERQQSGMIGYTTSTHCVSGMADGWPDETRWGL